MTGITNNRDTTRSQNFTYDVLNRLATAVTTSTYATSPAHCWGEAFSYDAWGNLQVIGGASSAYTGCTQESGFSFTATANNRMPGDCYDSAGNLLDQGACPSTSHTYTYNAENQFVSTAGVSYVYDGDGKRVSKSNGKLYWYGMASDTLAESDALGNITNEFVFFNGKRIARRDSSNNVSYYFADHLGTARVVTNSAGTILDDSDFYPFGGERPIVSSSGNTYKFTGKERDSESGLDDFGARYMSSNMGRFISTDPSLKSAITSDPQTWNRYAYTQSNPLRYVDVGGKCTAPAGIGKGQVGICIEAYIAAPRIRGIGLGDNRGPVANDSNATFRYQFQVVVDPSRSDPIVRRNDAAGTSKVGIRVGRVTGVLDTSPGRESTVVTKPTRDDQGNIHFTVGAAAYSGYAGQPGAPSQPILLNIPLVITPQGAVGVDPGGLRSSYPSLEAYSYSSTGEATSVLQLPETTPNNLGALNQLIPQVPPPPPPKDCSFPSNTTCFK